MWFFVLAKGSKSKIKSDRSPDPPSEISASQVFDIVTSLYRMPSASIEHWRRENRVKDLFLKTNMLLLLRCLKQQQQVRGLTANIQTCCTFRILSEAARCFKYPAKDCTGMERKEEQTNKLPGDYRFQLARLSNRRATDLF